MSSQKNRSETEAMASFNFYCKRGVSIDQILALKEKNFENQKPGRFYISEIVEWDHALLGALTEIFFYFHENGIVWNELKIFVNEPNKRFVRPLIQQANDWGLFKNLKLHFEFQDRNDEEADLCPGITSNNSLESLHLTFGGNLSGAPSLALSNLLQIDRRIKTLSLSEMELLDSHLLCQGLNNNKTLEDIYLDVIECYISDEEIAAIISASTSSPNLRDLRIVTNDQIGDLSLQALNKLLIGTTSLKSLELSDYCRVDNETFNTDHILQGLEMNRSLKSLSIWHLFGGLIFSRLFQILPNCPVLEILQFGGEFIITKVDIEKVIHMTRLPKSIILILGGQNVKCSTEMLERLLRSHPEIRPENFGFLLHADEDATFQHICNCNWHGRYLLDRREVPLSLWSLVLEKAKSKPSVIYEFLKGPVLVGRDRIASIP